MVFGNLLSTSPWVTLGQFFFFFFGAFGRKSAGKNFERLVNGITACQWARRLLSTDNGPRARWRMDGACA